MRVNLFQLKINLHITSVSGEITDFIRLGITIREAFQHHREILLLL